MLKMYSLPPNVRRSLFVFRKVPPPLSLPIVSSLLYVVLIILNILDVFSPGNIFSNNYMFERLYVGVCFDGICLFNFRCNAISCRLLFQYLWLLPGICITDFGLKDEYWAGVQFYKHLSIEKEAFSLVGDVIFVAHLQTAALSHYCI